MQNSEVFEVRNDIRQNWSGDIIGILVLDANYPYIPGNVANASTFTFPVRYKTIKDSSINSLLYSNDEILGDRFVSAAKDLELEGVKAIAGACGFMSRFQKRVQQSVALPVFLTSLMQLSFIDSVINKPVGIITADSSSLSDEDIKQLDMLHHDDLTDPVITGMQDCPAFSSAILKESGTLDNYEIRSEVLLKSRDLLNKNPDLGAILFECSDLPPYAHAVQSATGLPVFDYTTMINFVASAYMRKPFVGWT